ncbi:apolipoprotein N-acyltransferase [Thermus sp.]|uniref:apolipoprotein N-acyltransferase n=1 Tax=Thermus sp. TaxID=275 RepID=UPI0025FC8351|nr:apolipoprotein N-acyltransferase [Thermus sp.]MCS6868341.1 apolipoprotein N-acyltransferase [Thermus sp.]
MQALALGLLLALTLPPFPLGPLAPLVLVPLLRGGFRKGFWAGLGFWGLHLAWLPQSFAVLFGPWGAVPFLPLVLLKALTFGLLFALTPTPLLRVGGWVVLEWLTEQGELAFPWGLLGYALLEAPGRVLAAWGGVYLLSLLVLLLALGLSQRRYWLLLPWALLWLWPLPEAPAPERALLVQGNVNPLAKVQGDLGEAVYPRLTAQGLARHPEASLVVWPETAVWTLPQGIEGVLGGRPLVTGLNLYGPNRAVLYQGERVLAQYDKVRLVPFGERFPFREALGGVYAFFFRALGLGELADRTPGSRVAPLGPYGAMICYESVFPSTARALVREGAGVLVLLTNDAWYGPSFGGRQHFALGRLRAVETGRWLLRAGNDGITASIDPLGRVVAAIPAQQEGYLLAPFAFREGLTPYARYGDWAVGLALTLALLGLILRVRPPGWRNR